MFAHYNYFKKNLFMHRYCLALDLVNDEQLIAEYEAYHRDVWPAVKKSITGSGITAMDIYRTGNRLFMIMDTNDSFSFEQKTEMDNGNPVVQEWEQLMWKFQQSLPWAKPGEKWILMDRIFDLHA
jgi:L-rhamnose mutarotase